MGRFSVSTILLLFIAVALSIQQPASASWSDLAPVFPPLFNACEAMDCGKGSCRQSSNRTFPFVCECDNGWKRIHGGDDFPFLPCVVPDCSFDLSCTKEASPSPSPPLPPTNHSSFDDPCYWAYCGRGSCIKVEDFKHKCECNAGYANLFNTTYFPCFSECALEGQCKSMGIGLSNRSAASTPNLSDNGSSPNQAPIPMPGKFFWWIVSIAAIVLQM